MTEVEEHFPNLADHDGSSFAVLILTRLLQSEQPENQTNDEPGIFRKVLATILGLVGLIATVTLTYVVALLCDTTYRIFAPFRQNEIENETGASQGLDRDRLDAEVRKQIVKELFANETFLYSKTKKTTKEEPMKRKDDGEEESGIQLQDISINDAHTVETEDEESSSAIASPPKQALQPTSHTDTSPESREQDGSEMFTSSEAACCICLAPYLEGESILRSKHCTHMFHSTCCEDWIVQKPVCPLCAKPMILDAEWEATAASVLGQERYNALLLEQREDGGDEQNHSSSV